LFAEVADENDRNRLIWGDKKYVFPPRRLARAPHREFHCLLARMDHKAIYEAAVERDATGCSELLASHLTLMISPSSRGLIAATTLKTFV
jgi:DNA-binding GntR family transcriptional regulator